ncbi:hypothetical protein [Pedobacter sp. SYP-B3415]|uniref:hypothetical protein n=1 Tax=Pedobacter sp. SYP-B3415 TaxID=2496641 RepID=UPI00101BC231|nr:hypothetical protein [Pedobacter sp. SYP-B3415]
MRKILPLSAALLLSTFITFGQANPGIADRIRQAELSSSQIPWIAHYLTDVSGPRLTGSSGYMKAAEWAVATLKHWGLTRAGLEPWGTFGFTRA